MRIDAPELDRHAAIVGRLIADGKIVPFLGAGANLCDRAPMPDWRPGEYLPSGRELARFLAAENLYPGKDDTDLVRIAQYVDLEMGGEGELFDQLRKTFDGTYRPNALHEFLASLPAYQRTLDGEVDYQLIVTTNYDDVLETAFREAGEDVDVVYYVTKDSRSPGRFIHLKPDGERCGIEKHTEYRGLDFKRRPVIFKIHGAVDRSDESGGRYVITEDHYIDYLAHGSVAKLMPAHLMARMRRSNFLFLGYGMRDWNLRVILHHIWSEQSKPRTCWAVQSDPDPIDVKFWGRHLVTVVEAQLDDWVRAMTRWRG